MKSTRDIETVIGDIYTLINANFQTYIDSMNAERTDIELDDYNSDAFLTWEFDYALPYSVFYYLAPSPSPEVVSNEFGGTAVNYKVNFAVCIHETGECDMEKRIHRYITILIRMFNDKIVKEYDSCSITGTNTVPFEKEVEQGEYRKFEAPMITIDVPIIL